MLNFSRAEEDRFALPVEAAEILERIGDHATAAYARLRSTDPAQQALAEHFYASVGAKALATEHRRAASKG